MRLLKIAATHNIELFEAGMAWINIVTGGALITHPDLFMTQAIWRPLAWTDTWPVGLLLLCLGLARLWCIERCTTRLYMRAVLAFVSGFMWEGFAILQAQAHQSGIGVALFGWGLAPLCMYICARNILDTRARRQGRRERAEVATHGDK